MKTLLDARHLLGDGPALRAQFAREGYLYLPGVLAARQVNDLCAQVLGALQGAGWLAAGSFAALPGLQTYTEPEPEFFSAYAAVQSLEAFHRLAHAPELLAVLRLLLEEREVLVHPRKIARLSHPDHPLGVTPPHRDYRYVQGCVDVLTAWTPLGSYPCRHGGLKVLPGSHTLGLLPPKLVRGIGGFAVDVPDDHPGWVTADYQPGDVLLFHCLTVRGGTADQAGRIRISADNRFQSVRDPVVPATRGPHCRPDFPDWDVLTESWSTRDGIAPQSAVAVTPFLPPAGDLETARPRLVSVGA